VIGAIFHGPTNPVPAIASEQQMPATGQMPPHTPSDSAHMMPPVASDPVFEKVKSDPNNFDLLSQAGNAAMKAGNAKLATEYYLRALKVKEDLEVRTNLGNAYFRSGDADKSLAEFATVLKADPKNGKALYNTGVVRLMGKRDAKGAIASWETFLKYHPDDPHKAQVQEMIKKVKQAGMKAQG